MAKIIKAIVVNNRSSYLFAKELNQNLTALSKNIAVVPNSIRTQYQQSMAYDDKVVSILKTYSALITWEEELVVADGNLPESL